MEQVIIKSLNEVRKYRDQLKTIKIWIAHPCCGKSYLCKLDHRFVDLGKIRYSHNSYTGYFDENTILEMHELLKSGQVIFDNIAKRRISYFEKEKLPFVYVYAKPELQAEYVKRIREKNCNSEEKIQKFITRFDSRYFETADKGRALFKIEMGSGEYLSDYMWKVFGKPKKAHENKLGQFAKKVLRKISRIFTGAKHEL